MAKVLFNGAMSFQVVRGWPSCAMKHWRVAATSSCMLRIRLFCSTKLRGLERHGARDVLSVEESVAVSVSQNGGRSPVTELKKMWQRVDIQWSAGKAGLGRMVKPHPQKAESSWKQNQPEDPHGLGHNIQPLAESDRCRVVGGVGQQVVTGAAKW